MKILNLFLFLLVSSFVLHHCESAQIGSGNISIELRTLISDLGSNPTSIQTYNNYPTVNDSSLFVVTQHGLIYRYTIDGRNLTGEVFLNITSKVISPPPGYDERGLLGLAFHPNFRRNGIFYVWYNGVEFNDTECACDPLQFNTILNLEQYRKNMTNTTSEPEAVRYLLRVQKAFGNHNGLDNIKVYSRGRRMYLLTGDGGCRYDPFKAAQDPNKILGKFLNIRLTNWSCNKVIQSATFSELHQKCPRAYRNIDIAGYGLRNPGGLREFTINFTRYLSFVDVGQNMQEELNVVNFRHNTTHDPVNFGWNVKEGYLCVNQSLSVCPNYTTNYSFPNCSSIFNEIEPIAVADHDDPRLKPIAWIGGDLYRPIKNSSFWCLNNTYIFGDYAGHLYSTEPSGNNTYVNVLIPQQSMSVTSVGIGPGSRNIYVGGIIEGNYTLSRVHSVDCP